MTIGRETLRLADRLRGEIDRVVDAQTRDLVRAWAGAWDEVSTDLEVALREIADAAGDGKVTRRMVMRSQRLTRSLRTIGDKLTDLAEDAGVRITDDLDHIVTTTTDRQAAVVASQIPPAERANVLQWSRVDGRQIEAMVHRSTTQVTSRLRPLSSEATATMKRELVRGMTSGANPRDTARRMLARTEGVFNGGLSRAMTIARTETLDAHRAAALQSRKTNSNVLAGWVWTAELGARTCPSCWAQHGSLHDLDEPGPLDHQNGRCTAVPKAKSWRDLGIDLDEPADVLPDAAAVFKGLPEARQREILGPARHDAFKAGDYPMSAWSTKRSTSGWRDSYGVSRVPSRRTRRAA